MGHRGKKPRTDKANKLRGNPSNRKKTSSPVVAKVGAPTMPRFGGFDAHARAEWRRVVPIMLDRQTLTPDNRSLLMAYCCATSDFVKSRQHINHHGLFFTTDSGYQAQSPAVSVMNKASERIQRLGIELGLTPVSRNSIDAVATPTEESEIQAWLKQTGNARDSEQAS